MISPIPVHVVTGGDSGNDISREFNIELSVHGFETIHDVEEEIAPFPPFPAFT